MQTPGMLQWEKKIHNDLLDAAVDPAHVILKRNQDEAGKWS